MVLENDFQIIKQGAEAKLYRGTYLGKPTIMKERFKKCYRHVELDNHLTKERMKAEARAILKCKIAGICTPTLYLVDFERRRIYMEEIQNCLTVKDYIIQVSAETKKEDDDDAISLLTKLNPLAEEIGKAIGKLHASNIVHGDLTTSNMLLVKDGKQIPSLVLIDFGLCHIESSVEDKGVDLYVLERALISTHADVDQLFTAILVAYSRENKKGSVEVLSKLEEVRSRGRKRTMVG
ncbi:TP53-regulating kinase [Blattella germanica]|nr:TP53-regulating kinase [Blattella germanica]